VSRNRYATCVLGRHDQVKFRDLPVRENYEWSRFQVDEYALAERVGEVLFSPSHTELAPRQLAEWIVADNFASALPDAATKYLWKRPNRGLR